MRIRQILFNIFGNTQLVLQTKSLLLITTRIGKIHTRLGSDVRQLVLAFKTFNIGIHTTQFTFDDNQTFIDKLGGIYSYLILIIDHIFIIDSNKHIQNIFRTGSGYIIQNQVDNGSRLAGKRNFQSGTISFDDTFQIGFDYTYRLAIKNIRIVQRRSDNHRTNRSRNRIIQIYIQNFLRMNFPFAYSQRKIGKTYRGGIDRNNHYFYNLTLLRLRKRNCYRSMGVKFIITQTILHLITHIQMQTPGNLFHQMTGLENKYFIVYITFTTQKRKVGKSRRFTHSTTLRIIADKNGCLTAVYFRRRF